MKILLVEDDVASGSALAAILSEHHYQVDSAIDGKTALELVEIHEYDLILLDVLLPQLDGIQVCRFLRSHQYDVPILLLTAKDTSTDRVMGLDAGADDYLVKPYDLPELLARIRALLRRKTANLTSILNWENLTCDSNLGEIRYGQHLLKLTPKEYGILELFLSNPQRIFSRSVIVDRLWDLGESPGEDTVTTHIKSLRQKLKAVGATRDFIETVYGLGYRLRAIEPADPVPKSVNSETVNQIMAEMWERFKGEFLAKIEGLRQTAIALSNHTLSLKQREVAQHDAHKLAGSLGAFGYPKGSALAKKLERLLQSDAELSANEVAQLVRSLQQELNQPRASIASSPVAELRHVLLVELEPSLVELLQQDAIAWNVELEVASDLTIAKDRLAQTTPDAILLDLKPTSASKSLAFLAEVVAQVPKTPVFVVSESNQLHDRLEVAKLGAVAFLHKPIAPQAVFEHLTAVLRHPHPTTAKILVVDDDLVILQMLSRLLAPWGLHVTTLPDTQHFWKVLEAYAPDLLILDIAMPEFDGFELCQVVRNDAQWSRLPVLFLTSVADEASVCRAFSLGADDYIRKPIVPAELVSRILSRLHPVGTRRTLQT